MNTDLAFWDFALQASWSAETSSDAENWTADNPAWGQCAVTALVVQDEFGGQLLRSTIGGISHYWNLLPDGSEVDLTRKQFEDFALDGLPETRERSYVLSFPETERRYKRLLLKVCLAGALQRALNNPEDLRAQAGTRDGDVGANTGSSAASEGEPNVG